MKNAEGFKFMKTTGQRPGTGAGGAAFSKGSNQGDRLGFQAHQQHRPSFDQAAPQMNQSSSGRKLQPWSGLGGDDNT